MFNEEEGIKQFKEGSVNYYFERSSLRIMSGSQADAEIEEIVKDSKEVETQV